MSRMKTFFIYFLMVVICYFGSNTLIYAAINNTYNDIKYYQNVNSSSIIININEAKATSINGYIKGTVTNNSTSKIKETYLKIDFYSERDINMGTKYIKIENLTAKNTTEFEVNFKYSNVSYCIINEIEEI